MSKANRQAEDSSKKRTHEFVFTSMQRVFVRFLDESSARKKSFRDYLTFKFKKYFKNFLFAPWLLKKGWAFDSICDKSGWRDL